MGINNNNDGDLGHKYSCDHNILLFRRKPFRNRSSVAVAAHFSSSPDNIMTIDVLLSQA